MIKVLVAIFLLFTTSVATTVIYHKTQQTDINYSQAHRFFQKGNYDKSIVFCRKALAINPKHLKALHDLGYSCQWTGRHEEAVNTFRSILAIKPRDYKIKKSLAETLSWQQKYNESISLYKEVIAATKDIDSKTSLAEIYIWDQRSEKVREILRDVLTTKPEDFKANLLMGKALLYSGHAEDASRIFEGLFRQKINTDESKYVNEVKRLLADSYMISKNYPRAIEEYNKILESNPRDVKTMIALGDVLSWNKRYVESISEFERALEIEPGNLEIKSKLAQVSSWNKDYSRSIKLYKEVLEKTPSDVNSLIALGDVLSWNKRSDESIIEFERAMKIQPDNLEIKSKLAQVSSWNKDYSRSIKLYKEVLEKTPGDVNLMADLAEVLIWHKEYGEACHFLEKALALRDDNKLKLVYAEAVLYSGDYKRAEELLTKLMEQEPDNLKAKVYMADAYAYSKEFQKAIDIYSEVLRKQDDPEVKRKLADVLSWYKKYPEAIKLYDELIAKGGNIRAWLQKARVLGWARQYTQSLNEYSAILNSKYNRDIELEMKGKSAYWDGRVKKAIEYYSQLIKRDPENVEAMFDLSQIYSYQSMWKEAAGEYKNILHQAPTHFRANEGSKKAEHISRHILWEPGYEFIDANSQARDVDIRKHTVFNKIEWPLLYDLRMNIDQDFTARMFSDFSDVLENEGKMKFTYLDNPAGWVEGFYDIIAYNKGIKPMNTFGGTMSLRANDMSVLSSSYIRERMETSSYLLINNYYNDNFKERLDLDINKRLKIGADCTVSTYSDHNEKIEPAFDGLYYFSFDPLRLAVKYRYFFREFENKVSQYFSPKRFTTNAVEFDWRHYLNKEEVFFGADDLYYEAKYAISLDSQTIVSHKFTGGINWDVNNRLSLNMKGSFTDSSNDIYRDYNIMMSVRYYY